MEVNGEPEQFLRDQQVVVTYFGREMHVNKGKDKTGDSQEETTHSTDLTKGQSIRMKKGRTKQWIQMKRDAIDLEHSVVASLHILIRIKINDEFAGTM